VAEMHAGLQQFFHRNRSQKKFSFVSVGLMYSPLPSDFPFQKTTNRGDDNGLKAVMGDK
jgi:hypothetical protein